MQSIGYAEFENELKDLAIAKFVSISPVGTAHIIAHGLRPSVVRALR